MSERGSVRLPWTIATNWQTFQHGSSKGPRLSSTAIFKVHPTATGAVTMPDNAALWLNAKRAPFTIAPAPYTDPLAGEIVVRVRAVAVNPMDRAVQNVGDLITAWIKY